MEDVLPTGRSNWASVNKIRVEDLRRQKHRPAVSHSQPSSRSKPKSVLNENLESAGEGRGCSSYRRRLLCCAFELCSAQLLKDCRSEQRISERCLSHSDERVLVSPLDSRLVSIRDPKREQAQDTAGLLKSGQRLLLPLKDG
jgi:hypothetical protein